MSSKFWALIATLAMSATAVAQSGHAEIVDAQGEKIGTARIQPSGSGVQISVQVSQLTPGVHGIHIHSVGKCEGPTFASAGPHLNPASKQHGKDNPKGPHAGDLLNITVNADGTVSAVLDATEATLADGPNSVFHEGGTALVIHAGVDDYKTDPAGNSGARIACGVIQR